MRGVTPQGVAWGEWEVVLPLEGFDGPVHDLAPTYSRVRARRPPCPQLAARHRARQPLPHDGITARLWHQRSVVRFPRVTSRMPSPVEQYSIDDMFLKLHDE